VFFCVKFFSKIGFSHMRDEATLHALPLFVFPEDVDARAAGSFCPTFVFILVVYVNRVPALN